MPPQVLEATAALAKLSVKIVELNHGACII